jgi:hypothetical protein
MLKEVVVAKYYCGGICLEGLRKTTKKYIRIVEEFYLLGCNAV